MIDRQFAHARLVAQTLRISPGSGLNVVTAMPCARPERPAWSEPSPHALELPINHLPYASRRPVHQRPATIAAAAQPISTTDAVTPDIATLSPWLIAGEKCSAAATSKSLRALPSAWMEPSRCETIEFHAMSTPTTTRELVNAASPIATIRLTIVNESTYASVWVTY